MKKILTLALCAAASLLIFSCGSTPTSAAQQAAKDGVPTWVYEGKKASDGIYAVGAGKLSNDINSLKMAKDLMPKLHTDVIGKGLELKDTSVNNTQLVEVNAEIRNHPIEVVGRKLREYMTAMKPVL